MFLTFGELPRLSFAPVAYTARIEAFGFNNFIVGMTNQAWVKIYVHHKVEQYSNGEHRTELNIPFIAGIFFIQVDLTEVTGLIIHNHVKDSYMLH